MEKAAKMRPGTAAVVLARSADVMATVGDGDRLAELLASSRTTAPMVAVHQVPGVRLDILLQRLTSGDAHRLDPPAGLAEWVSLSTSPVRLPEGAVLLVVSMADVLDTIVVRVPDSDTLIRLPAGYRSELGGAELAWLDERTEPVDDELSGLASALEELSRVLADGGIEWLVYNVATFIPGEQVEWYRRGEPEPLAVRAHRVDLLLDEMAATSGLAVVDLDRMAAEYGAGGAVVAPGVYSSDFNALVTDETLATIAALPGISRRFGPDAMHLILPRYDRRTQRGVVERWAVEAGSGFAAGDELFVAKFDELATRLDGRTEPSLRSMRMSVIATRPGHLRSTKSAGAEVEVGAVVGVITTDAWVEPEDAEISAVFPTGIRVHEG